MFPKKAIFKFQFQLMILLCLKYIGWQPPYFCSVFLPEAQSTVAEIKCQNCICQVKKINSMLQGGLDNTEVACLLFTQQPWF